jgi:hypothetical protein
MLTWSLTMALFMGCESTPYSGLKPVAPPAFPSIPSAWSEKCYAPTVPSLQPTLEWASFPDSSLVSRVSQVTYDLKLWRAATHRPDELIYERTGLSSNSHQIEIPLKPKTEYVWTVRARFRLDNRSRVSQWAHLLSGTQCASPNFHDSIFAPFLYFPFKTPQ